MYVVDAFKLLFAMLPHKLLFEMKFCTCIGVTQTVLSFICCCTSDWYICAETGSVIIPLMPTGKTDEIFAWGECMKENDERLTISIFVRDYQLAILRERLWEIDLHVLRLAVHLHCMHCRSITLSVKLRENNVQNSMDENVSKTYRRHSLHLCRCSVRQGDDWRVVR